MPPGYWSAGPGAGKLPLPPWGKGNRRDSDMRGDNIWRKTKGCEGMSWFGGSGLALNNCPSFSPHCDLIVSCSSWFLFVIHPGLSLSIGGWDSSLPPSFQELPALDTAWAPQWLGPGCRLSPGLFLCERCPGRPWVPLQRLPPDGSRCSEKRNSTLILERLFPGKLEEHTVITMPKSWSKSKTSTNIAAWVSS